ncbi:MAG: hypothetical protein PWQ55_101 [Chloroflexota bacterium]|nr:hypothetical protein [Chloroflexota bacterium]
MKKPETKSAVQQARAALKQGDKTRAKELALRATSDPVQAEQAWLILASLSDKQQALLYVENALKVNPESQAARKAVRLIYSQMASEKSRAEHQENEIGQVFPPAAPIQTLDDTAPIPVEKDSPETTAADGTLPINSASISKGALRAKLRQRSSTPVEEVQEVEDLEALEDADSSQQAAATADSAPKKKGLLARITRTEDKPEDDAAESIAEISEDRSEEAAAAEKVEQAEEPPATPETVDQQNNFEQALPAEEPPAAEPAPQAISEQTDEVEQPAPVEEPPAAEAAPQAISEQADEVEQPAPAEELPATEPTPQVETMEEPVEKVLNSAAPRKMGVDLPVIANDKKERNTADKLELQSSKSEPANVDTIELVLVSVSAILIPLLVFLYFYLTK